MPIVEDLTVYYADFGEPVTIAGAPVTAIFDGGYQAVLDVAGTTPTLRCITSTVASVVRGTAVVRAGVNYTVAEIQPIAPDELETRLILQRV